MSARSSVTGPGWPPVSVPSTPVLPIPVRTSSRPYVAERLGDEARRVELDHRELRARVQMAPRADQLVVRDCFRCRACGTHTFREPVGGRPPRGDEYRRLFRQIGARWQKRSRPERRSIGAGSTRRAARRDALRNMLLQRQLDNRGFQLNRQGKIPFALGSEGHEALQAGAAMAFVRGSDILVPVLSRPRPRARRRLSRRSIC